jgi:hypothetical protein
MGHTGPYDPSYDTIPISVIQPGHVNFIFILRWYAMVAGQAKVLYSRLNVLATDPMKLRWVL